MGFLITPITKTPASKQPTKVRGVPIQSSVVGAVIPIVFGTTRIAGNLIWYGDFKKNKVQSSSASSSSGKGGLISPTSGNNTTTITYKASFAFGLCEGPIVGVKTVYESKHDHTPDAIGFSIFNGNFAQAPWSYLTTQHPGQDLTYSGLAYAAISGFDLATSPAMPNFNYEVTGLGPIVSDGVNVNPADVVVAILTNSTFGAGFPRANLAGLATYRAYCDALGLYVSPAYASQTTSASILTELADLTNSVFVWTGSLLDVVPRGDEAATGNGASYIPPQAPLFDLNDDDFIDQGSTGPVQLARARPSDAQNAVTFEYLNASQKYANDTVEAKDDARINLYGLRAASPVQAHLFTNSTTARLACQLYLQRQLIRNLYKFRLDQRYLVLDPMDIVSITDASLGLNKQWVRILEIDEGDGYFDIIAEEYLGGTGAAATYNVSPSSGYAVDYNAAASSVDTPLFFEPTDQLGGGLEVMVAVTGQGNWGGCDVYVSLDGTNYSLIGRVLHPARMGTLTSSLASVTPSTISDTTLDTANTLAVDISQSGFDTEDTLISVSTADAEALSTVCYVDGEFIAYRDAVLTSAGHYNLSFLERGAFGSTPAAHASGSRFCRVDNTLISIPFAQGQIGTTLKIKLPSFNPYGGGAQSLADVPVYTYTLLGTALASPLPDVTNFRTVFSNNITYLDWVEVTDFRPVTYEIRKGSSWPSAQSIGQFAHPPVPSYGDGTYWIAAFSQPASGIKVYSNTPASLTLSGSVILENTVQTWDENATGWSGTLGGSAVLGGGGVETNTAGGLTSGTYEIPASHDVDVGSVHNCKLSITWQSAGIPVGANVLTLADYLNTQDFLNSNTGSSVSVYPEINISQDGVTYAGWQRFSPGVYVGRKFKARMQLVPLDPAVYAVLTGFTFTVDLSDHSTTLASAAHGGI